MTSDADQGSQPEYASLRVEPGVALHTATWRPEHPKAILVISHGYAEHLGRYEHVAAGLVDAGFVVWALDHRGHGRSDGARMVITDMSSAGRDIDRLADRAAAADPELPLFLLGHSMGSVIATEALLFDTSRWTGAILSGSPMAASSTLPAFQIEMLRRLARLRPSLRIAPQLSADTICSDPKVVQSYLDDPLVDNGRMPVGTGASLIITAERHQAELGGLDLPALLIHGEQDELTPIAGSELLLEALGEGDRTFLRYPGRHEVLNESFGAQVLADVINWAEARMGNGQHRLAGRTDSSPGVSRDGDAAGEAGSDVPNPEGIAEST